ncbi:PLP-dependent aminotransferase family protein [Mycobacterium asiaticum]|uniref:GntR family transcriptional regulator n=1 Tax=Mycobacterium asiaticum TaxID=1790 RepID=A0A1A3MV47_MYCAS|nr:PLP-dependent aminotransferase family protein [Mycobacterium asiaticum]OBK12679.1 GntR family transcriptional regulator [Mycobacterium asiaticum]
MTSRANSGGRDLHLDLRPVVRPGARGVRELLITALRDAVRSGRLAVGTVLPPARSLAADLGLARNTVAEAYAELVAEGWLASRQGSGTWVADGGRPAPAVQPRGAPGTPRHNLLPGSPDVSAFPRSQWLASARRALTSAPNAALRLGDSRGRPELREALAEYLGRARGVRTSAESIMICAGTRHSVELLAKTFGPARPIAVEVDSLFLFREAIASLGGATVPIGIDELGARVSDLVGLDTPAALITAAHQYPHGVPLDPSRRTAVLDWARCTGGYVIEDDYDGEFRYDRQPVGALQGLGPDRVIYLGSLSKTLSPALRMGWIVLPAEMLDAVVTATGGEQFYVNAIDQLTMADFITSGQYDRHIRRMRAGYRRRRETLVAALSDFDVGISGVPAGLHLLLTLPDGAEQTVLRRAGEAGVAVAGLARLRHPLAAPDAPQRDGIVVNFGTPADHEFAAALGGLCDVLRDGGLAR